MPVPDFSPGEVLTAAAMDQVGLWKIAETSFTTTATPFINGCFSSNYQNYLVKIVLNGSGTGNVFFRMRSGTSTPETGAVYDRYGFSWTTVGVNLVNPNNTAGYIADIAAAGNSRTAGDLHIFNPNEATNTIVNSQVWDTLNGTLFFPTARIETTTQYTGIEITTLGGPTLTGTMRVYGYRN